MASLSDSFNRANSSGSLGTPSDGGPGYTVFGSGTFSVDNNEAKYDNASDASAVRDAASANVELTAKYLGAGANWGIVARLSDNNNKLLLYRQNATTVRFQRVVAGSFLGTVDRSISLASGDTLSLRMNGDTMTVRHNGVAVGADFTESHNNTATKHGLWAFGSGGRWDDLSIADLAPVLTPDRAKVLTGSGTVQVTVTASNVPAYTVGTPGTPTFALTGAPIGWSISGQQVTSTTTAVITLNKGGGAGDFTLSDGTASCTLTATVIATTVASGNSSATDTWDAKEVPAAVNNAAVAAAHTLLIDAGLTVTNLTAADTGNVTLAAGVTFTCDTAAIGNGVFQLGEAGGGANLVFGASFTVGGGTKTNARFRTRGTGGSITSTASGTITVTDGLFDIQGTGTMQDLGGAATDSLVIAVTSASSGDHVLTGWTRTNCGRFNTANTLPAGMGITYSLKETTAAGTASCRLAATAPGVGVTRLVDLASFAGAFSWTEGSFTFGTVVLDGEGGGETNSGVDNDFGTEASPCFVRSINLSGTGLTGFPLRGNAFAYFLGDAGTDNPHNPILRNTGSQHTLGGVIEYTRTTSTDQGNSPYGAGDWVCEKLVILPGVNTASPGAITPVGSGLTVRVRHCTLFSPQYAGGIMIGDGGEATGQVPEVKGNIFWHDTAASTVAVTAIATATTTDDVVTPAGCTHNGILNPAATVYQGDYPTTQPGANDVTATADPSTVFHDHARNIATWAVTRGSVGATYADRVIDARSYLRADPSLVADLFAHVRAGFAVVRSDWRTAAHDGTVLGAVQDAAGDTTAPAVVSIVGDGNRVRITYDEALDESAVPATGAFDLQSVAEATVYTVQGVTVSGTLVDLTITPPFAAGVPADATLDYTGGSGAIRDVALNEAATFTDSAVTNATVDLFHEDDAATNAAGTEITLSLSESGCLPASGSGHFTLTGTAATVASWTIGGAVVTMTLSGTIYQGETVGWAYAQTGTGDITDADGTTKLANSSGPVMNNSTVAEPLFADGAGAATLTLTTAGAGSALADGVATATLAFAAAGAASALADAAGASTITFTAAAEYLPDGDGAGAATFTFAAAAVGGALADAAGATSLTFAATGGGSSIGGGGSGSFAFNPFISPVIR